MSGSTSGCLSWTPSSMESVVDCAVQLLQQQSFLEGFAFAQKGCACHWCLSDFGSILLARMASCLGLSEPRARCRSRCSRGSAALYLVKAYVIRTAMYLSCALVSIYGWAATTASSGQSVRLQLATGSEAAMLVAAGVRPCLSLKYTDNSKLQHDCWLVCRPRHRHKGKP
jgi:hypothetical protein